tara:strand:- start:43 stop:1326 length:1284 start_codon:yes stop_codon:yes gene_type:complete
MSITTKEEIVVDLSTINEFTQAHLATTRKIYHDHWKKFYPELFGDKLPDAIEFEKFDILPAASVTGDQSHRVGSRSVRTKLLEIKQNIERNGFKLKYPPIAWFRWHDGADGIECITGNSRGEILSQPPFQTKNRIVALYKRRPGFTDEQVQDAIESCGLRFNAIHDPAAPLSTFDVKRTVSKAIDRWKNTDGKAGVKPTLDAITNRVDYVCGEGIFQPSTKLNLIYEIYNNYNPHDVVISWSDVATAKYRISSFMTRSKLVDTDKVKYLWTSHELYSKAFTRACKIAAEYPDAEVRIIIHTATLKGYNLSSVYRSRVQKFVSEFKNIVHVVGAAADKDSTDLVGATFSRIKIYGALPTLGANHDLEIPFILNERTGKFYQKGSDYTFDVSEDDVSEDDVSEDDVSESVDLEALLIDGRSRQAMLNAA